MFRSSAIGLVIILVFLSSCSKDKKIERSLRGEWSASKESIEATAKLGPTDSSGYHMIVMASGSCSFNKDGTGNCQWTIQNQVKKGTGIVMSEEWTEKNQFKWHIEDEHLILEHEGMCHCNMKEERYKITNRDENQIICESITESQVEMDCPMCGGTVREQFRWRLTLTKM